MVHDQPSIVEHSRLGVTSQFCDKSTRGSIPVLGMTQDLRGLPQAAAPLFFSLVFFRRLVVSFSGRVHAVQAPT